MGTQLYLPAGWARRLESRLDPVERLTELERTACRPKAISARFSIDLPSSMARPRGM